MSVQFGRWNFEGQPPSRGYIEKVSATLAPYGPDNSDSYSKGGTTILYRAFHTTKESHCEKQPCISSSGDVITWDGRLDNRAELISELCNSLTINSPDVAIVAASYEKWGVNCLGKLIGDWALSIWNPRERFVLLAKDPLGTKHLYYSFDDKQLTWSTILDPLVLLAGKTFEICEEYIAGWFAIHLPAAHLTPYVGIHAVRPSSFVLLRPGKHIVSKYWDFDPGKAIRYRTNAEYEEHFRSVFATAVQRRIHSDRPILADLSGGIDSSSIVCMADLVIARGHSDCPRLDTVTWYDKSKPNWGEFSHFTNVEQKRGRVGHHIDFSSLKGEGPQRPFGTEFASDRFAATPIPNNGTSEVFRQNAAYIRSQGYRVTLCGIGGGEVTGDGVPTPTPEFQNLLARLRFVTLGRQLKTWAAKMRKPQLPLLWEALRGFVFRDISECANRVAPWFRRGFLRRNRAAFCGYPSRVKMFGPLPSFQHNLRTLDADRRLLALWLPKPEPLREVRFPYLDRDFLEFMYAIPREQIVGVGRRRFLMKRALVGIVPDEILNRKKKEMIPQATSTDVSAESTSAEWPNSVEIGQHIVASSIAIIDQNRFREALQRARRNEEFHIESVKNTLILESWLRRLTSQRILANSISNKRQDDFFSFDVKELHGPAHSKSSAS
jgi:asparagine synthase (glutamine-hydrolysing)